MRSLMGESAEQDFIFEDGFYPRLRHMDERPGRLAASPILFARGENADSIKHPFYVDTNYGVRWISLSPGLVDIVGDSGYVRMPVAEDSVVRIEAWKEDFSKHVYLTIRARSFVDKEIGYDTVCHGDSVWMKNTYARNEGWNYDVVWGEGTDTSPDTVYRLHLHHKRVYRDTLHFEVARDSLPYIYKEDTIKWFGLTELHRYLTIEGCDSIIYVQLDTLDNRREIHHWDTLCLCSGDTSVRYWRGVPITGVGEVYDEVIDPYKGGIDTFYHLQSYISPTYRDTLYFLVERDSLPYIHGKDTIRQFGWTTLKALTVHGCDSITYVRLDTLYIHREQHFYDTLHTCEGGTLSWRDREITHTGDYTDTVFDPYKGGTDSIHHLRALVYPVHHTTYIDSCYIEELPYMVGGRLMQDFGEQTERYVTVEGCDSVYTYVLAPRWHPSQVHGVVTIEGDGIVCMQENTFQGAGTYVFEVEEGSEFHFRIKPGKQFYLDSLWVGGGMPLPVSRDSIYAERDDTLHYYYRIAQGNIGFHFIFKEVQPWQGGVDKAYRSKDKSYVQIYRPEELFVREIQTISLQNNLDFACIDNSQYRLHTNLQYFQGNDKILYNLCNFEIFNIHFNDHTKMSNLHLRGRSSWAISMDRTFFNGITIGSDVSVSGMYSLPTSFFPMQFINCIFFSDNLDSHYTYAAFRLYKTSKNLINWGKGSVCVYVHRYNDSVYISNIFNFGRNKKLISCENGVGPKIFFSYFNDKNLVPDIELPTHEWTVGYNLESRQLIDSAFMRSLMGDSAEEDFIFEDGFYPRLRHMDERPGRLAASPILLYPGENADSVTLPFYVDTNYGVRWVSLNEDIIRIEGNVGYVRHPVPKETTVRVEAWKEDFNKHVYLDVPASNFVYQDLLSDTVCPGDSVKMINSYARNEGWNYEVVETASAEYDTIYRMYLHHYPTYREVVHRAAVERDSLPYIFGRDTIRNFGLTELHRYQSVHGCDSITYVRLDTLYIHREQHF
ncbi:hypothetical protein HDR62_01705, partial [bacterium]|nr:hypothetical protein [bacterium]